MTRLELTNDVQQELSKIFAQQEADFKRAASEKISFDGKYKPDEGEVLVIGDYEDLDEIHGAIANPMSILPIRPDTADFEEIKAIFTGRVEGDSKIALIQNFDRKRVLSTRGFSLFHSANVFKKVEGIGLTLDDKLCAILTNKSLEFFNFTSLRRIFDLTKYYKNATDEDIKSFASMGNVRAADVPALIEAADTVIRKKVSFVMQSGILEEVQAAEIKQHASAFGISIETAEIEGSMVIILPTERAKLKELLRFLDEDYYRSVLRGDPYLSNSKRSLKR
ncbi:Kiwa anti-phage protein KwaB-like domain-containing protein [Methylobacterium oryzae]|uniref:Kiwa anti-phage protein KwaB-like domain-containing protein n=1 Tax=Methylobacterium oryzae TaxID=334852 RepID=UPI002F355C7F